MTAGWGSKQGPVTYRRFARNADAIRIAIEELTQLGAVSRGDRDRGSGLMSALGQKRTSTVLLRMSALGQKRTRACAQQVDGFWP